MRLIITIYRFFLSRRYKVEIRGLDILKTNTTKLILPNHQAIVDPQLMFMHLYKYTNVVPVASEIYMTKPILKQLFKNFGAVPVSDITVGNRDMNALKNIYINITNALKEKKNVLLYPAGQIAGQGFEKIFNKQSAWAVVNNLPENTQVIGVRISGLWGSMWSRAWNGKSPGFFKPLLKGIFYVFANFLFFVPKRKVIFEFKDITEGAIEKAKANRISFNLFLEEFYNLNGAEEVNYLKHYFFAPKLKRKLPERIEGSVEDQRSNAIVSEEDIPEEILQNVSKILVKIAGVNPKEISLNSNLSLDLNIDSLLMVETITAVEEEFKVVSQFEITLVKTVGDLCRIAMNQEIFEDDLKPSFLHNHLSPIKKIEIDNSKNIVDNFIHVFSSYKKDHFAYDKILGSTTRKDIMLKAFVVSKIIRKEVKGKHVGIMLPALQSTALLVISTYLAGKIPVMLNWTVGKKVLDHCIETIDLDVILTAKTFHDKVADLLTDNVKQKCVFFEQKVKEATLRTKLAGLISNMFKITPKIDFNDVAVILFTSGSESLPKAVPLTHRNVIDNLWGVFEIVEIENDRVFLAFLPPFHSFGFTVLTILPLITGLKVAYTPDPTDNRELLKILKHTQANTVLATPTFLKMLLSISTKKDFRNVDLAITGAESLNPAIIKTFKEKGADGARILEGYGITECSPVLTINPMDLQKEKSVGKFITGITYHITDIITYTPLKQSEEGMIMVKGKSIFNGYQDKKLESPFVKINGEDFYKTGDLGRVDEDGYLFITGRLKRFIKIGGEMISLPALENTLLKKYGSEEEVVMAIEGSDTIEPPQIALFSKIKIDINEANAFLKENGFSGIVKIHQVIEVDEIPLLGTGKTDYKILKEQIVN